MILNDMIISENENIKVTMKLFYEKLEMNKKIILELNSKHNITKINPYILKLTENISVKILNINYDNFFDFSILNFNLRNILINPIKVKIEINDSMKEIDIISDNQVNYIVKENKVIDPYSFCKKCKVRNGLIF